MAVNDFGCVNNTIRLRSGRYFDLANPDPATICIQDIAGALSRISRFGGQADPDWSNSLCRDWDWMPSCFRGVLEWFSQLFERNYSVAEHLIHCADQATADGLPGDAVFAVFMHDAAEAFINDMVRPLKVMMPQYREVETRVEAAIAAAFGVDFDRWHSEIKEIDNAMVLAERRVLFSPDNVTWKDESTARKLSPRFRFMLPRAAERRFMSYFRRLA